MGIMKNINDIVERNINLVPFVINKMGLQYRYDDYVDIGWIGLVYGAKNYDETKGKESTFLYKSIKMYIMSYVINEQRKQEHLNKLLSLDHQSTDNDESDEDMYNVIGENYTENSFMEMYAYDCITKVLDTIDNRKHKVCYSEVLKDYYGFGRLKLKTKDLMEKYNISKETIRLIKLIFRKKLKKELGLEE